MLYTRAAPDRYRIRQEQGHAERKPSYRRAGFELVLKDCFSALFCPNIDYLVDIGDEYFSLAFESRAGAF